MKGGGTGCQPVHLVIHSDDFGKRWNLRLSITPVIKPLIQRTLFYDSLGSDTCT